MCALKNIVPVIPETFITLKISVLWISCRGKSACKTGNFGTERQTLILENFRVTFIISDHSHPQFAASDLVFTLFLWLLHPSPYVKVLCFLLWFLDFLLDPVPSIVLFLDLGPIHYKNLTSLSLSTSVHVSHSNQALAVTPLKPTGYSTLAGAGVWHCDDREPKSKVAIAHSSASGI